MTLLTVPVHRNAGDLDALSRAFEESLALDRRTPKTSGKAPQSRQGQSPDSQKPGENTAMA